MLARSWPGAGQILAHPCSPKCRPGASDDLQNAVLEPPMASRSPNSANRRKSLLQSNKLCYIPPPPAWQGRRACEIQARLRQIELRGAPHLPPSPPRPGPIPLPKMPSSSLRWPPKCRPGASDGLQIAKLCKCLQKYAKFSKLMLNSAKLCQFMLKSAFEKIIISLGGSAN